MTTSAASEVDKRLEIIFKILATTYNIVPPLDAGDVGECVFPIL